MSILITGGTGYIGSHTVVELMKAGYDPVIVDNLCNSKVAVLDRIAKITGKKPRFYQVDVCDKEALAKVFEQEKEIESVIHFAGLKAVGESVSLPLRYYENNLISTLVLLEVMKEHNVKNIIFSSSATVYGTNECINGFKETDPVGGTTNPYGTTKYFIERILQDAYVADKNLNVILLRYFNPIGAHSSGLLGEDPNGIPNNLMPYVTQVAIGKLKMLHVFGDNYPTPDGTGVRDYIHVVDLALGHLAAVRYLEKKPGVEIFNLGTGVGVSVFEVIKAFEKANNIKIPFQVDPRRPGDIATCYADASKALKLLQWKTQYSIVDACKDSWNFQRNNPDGIK